VITPRTVDPDLARRELRVLWADGHRSTIPFQTLRDHCPCARCLTSREQGRKPLPMALTTKLDGWKKIGNYALQFSWGDSHADGIFAFDVLRGLCTCEACVAPAPPPPTTPA